MTELQEIDFHGCQILTFEQGGRPFAAVKPIAEALGLDWSGQLRLIKRDNILAEGMVVTSIPSREGGAQDTACLPLDLLHGWLFKLPSSRYSVEVREKVDVYRRECFRVLYDFWFNGGAINPNASPEQVSRLERELESTRIELEHWKSSVLYGEVSENNGLRRTIRRRGTWVAPRADQQDNPRQLTLGLQ